MAPQEISTQDGRVIFRAGTRYGASEIELALQRDLHATLEEVAASESKLLSPYDRQAQERVEKCIHLAVALVDEAVRNLSLGRAPLLSQMDRFCGDALQEIAEDPATVLSVWAQRELDPQQHNEYLSQRCSKLALLSGIMAHCLDLSQAECRNASIAGLLHDLSLFHPFVDEQRKAIDPRDAFLQHPNRSLELLRGIPEVTPFTQIVITQVHEQVDGSGYPRGLLGHQTSLISRILNLADAYICMLEPHPLRPSICPSDAIAYLIHQTILGRFDKNCMEAFLVANSVYPVGSKVELQDFRKATVIRSSGEAYSQPVIQLVDPPHSILDLRKSGVAIERPSETGMNQHRLPLSRFDQILWKHPLAGEQQTP